MAKIWFLNAGEIHEGKFVADKPLDFCFHVLGLRVWKWHSPLERNEPLIIGTKEDTNNYLVVEVTSKDSTPGQLEWKTGYYVLDVDVTDARKLLMIHKDRRWL
jgi:hypothetical protein